MPSSTASPVQLLALQYQIAGLRKALQNYGDKGASAPPSVVLAVTFSLQSVEATLASLVSASGVDL